jgi:hypothetical protein
VALVALAEAALALFAVLPNEGKVLALFVNGLPLGMVWGVVVRYLEGRRITDVLLAGLSISYIVSSGIVKDLGRWLMAARGVSEAWMPFTAGMVVFPVLVASVWGLEQIPPPGAEDEAVRGRRKSMDREERGRFLGEYGFGLVPLLAVYCLLTAYRDFRDNYGVEIFQALGASSIPALFTVTELAVGLGVLACLALINLLPTNRVGLLGLYGVMGGGIGLIGVATLLWQVRLLGGVGWMIAVGLGSYLAYVPFGAVLFDRLMAVTRAAGTAVYAVSLADALGYSVAVAFVLYKDVAQPRMDHLGYFVALSYLTCLPGVALLGFSGVVLWRKTRRRVSLQE